MFAGGGLPGKNTADDHVIVLNADELEWYRFQKSFAKATGLDLNEYRGAQMRRRVRSVAQSVGETVDSLGQRVKDGPVLAAVTLHQIAIHTTQLFRDLDRWIELQENILPRLTAGDTEIRVWCAGCANGAEAYSLASVLETTHSEGSILATDIDSIILEQAVKGRFTNAQGKHASGYLNRRHFESRADSFVASPVLSRRISFKQQNVLAKPPSFHFDLVCCRNVAIYLKDAACERLYRNLCNALRPGGYLFLGTTERLFAPEELGFEAISPCFYRKLD